MPNTAKKTEFDLLTGMSSQQKIWLHRVADLLESSPGHLLASAMIDSYDLAELIGVNPQLAANMIRATWPPSVYRPI